MVGRVRWLAFVEAFGGVEIVAVVVVGKVLGCRVGVEGSFVAAVGEVASVGCLRHTPVVVGAPARSQAVVFGFLRSVLAAVVDLAVDSYCTVCCSWLRRGRPAHRGRLVEDFAVGTPARSCSLQRLDHQK